MNPTDFFSSFKEEDPTKDPIEHAFRCLNKIKNSTYIPPEWRRLVEDEETRRVELMTYNRSHFPTRNIRPRRKESRYEEEWKKRREREGKTYQLDIYHNCIQENCREPKEEGGEPSIRIVSNYGGNDTKNTKLDQKTPVVYQCEDSGKVHICKYNSQCDLIVNTKEGNFCYFSGICVDDLVIAEEPSFNDLERVNYDIKPLPQITKSSILTQKESLLPGPRKKKYAMPSARFIKLPQQSGGGDGSDNNCGEVIQRKQQRRNTPDFKKVFNSVIESILFDREKRERINQEKRDEAIKKWINSRESSQPLNLIDAFNYTIHQTENNQLAIDLNDDSFKTEKIEFYYNICKTLWNCVQNGNVFKRNLSNDNRKFVIAFLYLLSDCQIKSVIRNGDSFITNNLPNQIDLSRYWKEFRKNYVVDSKKKFKKAFQEATHERWMFIKYSFKKIEKSVKEMNEKFHGTFDFIHNFLSIVK